MKRILVATSLLLFQCFPASASDPNCMNDYYYRNKLPSCIDDMLSPLRTLGSKADPNTVIGFLAQLFIISPEERKRLLESESSDYVRSAELVALYRAGLLDDARKFSDKNGLSVLLQKLQAAPPAPLATVRPSSIPADNDLLIGAYMASGDTTFIQRILENFSGADNGMVSDGLRMGYLMGKFGNRLAPKERDSVTLAAARAKYQPDPDPAKLYRLLTLMTATWALQSLSGHDDGIKRTVANFFERDARLKNLLVIEQTAFGNYLLYVIALTNIKDNQPGANRETLAAMHKSVSIYENLGPADEAFAPFASEKK